MWPKKEYDSHELTSRGGMRVKHSERILFGFVVVLALVLMVWTGCTKQKTTEPEKEAEKELPAAVGNAVKANFPDAEIDFVEVTEEAGITLYDIEFKADQGEIELTADGTVLDVVTIITIEELPKAAAEAILKAAEDITILRLEKSEIRSEIKVEGEKGQVVKLDSPKYVYEAELKKGDQTGEIEVDADGKIIEPLKWDIKKSEEKDK
jgi:uncharacterized membrane protein YkoI